MMDATKLWVGQAVYVGVKRPRKAAVWAVPFLRDERWIVPVQYLNGVRENVHLFMVYARELEESRVALKELVKVLGYDDAQLAAAKKRQGIAQ